MPNSDVKQAETLLRMGDATELGYWRIVPDEPLERAGATLGVWRDTVARANFALCYFHVSVNMVRLRKFSVGQSACTKTSSKHTASGVTLRSLIAKIETLPLCEECAARFLSIKAADALERLAKANRRKR